LNKIVDISRCEKKELGFLTSSQHVEMTSHSKGWSYSFVYSFLEIRNVFLLLAQSRKKNIKDLFSEATNLKLPYIKSEWKERRLLEHVNALINFGLIDKEWNVIDVRAFSTSFSDGLSELDIETFKRIFFEYFRFKEIALWYRGPLSKNIAQEIQEVDIKELKFDSRPLFHTSYFTRFTDTFFYELDSPNDVFVIPEQGYEDQKRFWDVFLIWGISLGVIEKISLEYNGYKTESGRNISISYFVQSENFEFDVVQFIKENFKNRQIEIPELLLKICIEFRVSLEKARKAVLLMYETNKQRFTFERTSEVFIKKGEIRNEARIPYLKYNDSYISHLIIRT
jgi:hypothetical protein